MIRDFNMLDFLRTTVHGHSLALVLALMVGALYAAPHVYFAHTPAYRGIYMAESSDEDFYMTTINKISYSGGIVGNPYLFEYQNIGNPFQYYGAEFALAKVKTLFHLSIAELAIAMKLVFPAALFLLMYLFFYTLAGTKQLALLGSTAVMLGNELAQSGVHDVAATFLLRSPFTDFLTYARPINPSVSGLFFFGAFISLLYLLRNPRSKWAIGVSALLLGLLAYLYVFFWVFACVLLGVMFLYAALTRNKILCLAAVVTGVIGIGISLPFLFALLSSVHGSTSESLFAVPTHRFIVEKVILIPLFIFTCIYGYEWWQRRRGRASAVLSAFTQKYMFVFLLLIAGELVSNQQVITGRLVQPHHFHFYINIPLFLIASSLLFYAVLEQYLPRFKNLLIGVSILFLFAYGAGVQISSYRAHEPAYVQYQNYSPALAWLNASGGGKVVLTDEYLATRVTMYTNDFVYVGPTDLAYQVPFLRLEHDYFVLLYLRGVRSDTVRAYVYTPSNRDEISVLLVGAEYYRDLCGSYSCFPDSKLESLIADYKVFLKQPFETQLTQYRVDYVLWDKTANPEWHLEQFPFLQKVYDAEGIAIYQVK
ncbi:MAG TPA: hypothetical protein VIJ88_02960 [Candidatus Paceibacterota bacterium]